jgi:hypothetical protein
VIFDWLALLTFPAGAVASALVVGFIHRHDELENGALLRRFILVLAIALGLIYTIAQRPSVQLQLHPELRLKADIEADPIYKTLADIGPEYAAQFQAVLAAEQATIATLPEARLQARTMLMALATRRLEFTDQAAHVAWGQAMLDTFRELQVRSADECYAALSGQALSRETLAHGFSAENSAEFEAAALQVLESSGKFLSGRFTHGGHPNTDQPADFNATMRDWQGIQDEIAQAFSPEVSALVQKNRFPPSPPMSADTVCAARIYQLDAMLKRPKAAAALLIDSVMR